MPSTISSDSYNSNQSCHSSHFYGLANSCNIYSKESHGINNVDQGYFNNIASKQILNIPSIDLAYMTNNENNETIDSTINLNPTMLTWNDFCNLFFRFPSGSFYINTANSTCAAISFSSQTYETTQNKRLAFSIYEQIVKAWSKKMNRPDSSIPIPAKIHLDRHSFLTKSLASINNYQLGLSLDEIITTLLDKKQIEPSDEDNMATVKFNISYKDYFCPLNTSILIVFTFITNIPFYKNVSDSDSCNYSNEIRPPRTSFNCDDSVSDIFDSNESKQEQSYSGQETEFYINDSASNSDIESHIEKILVGENSVSSQCGYN
jgi:hypothetical protein